MRLPIFLSSAFLSLALWCAAQPQGTAFQHLTLENGLSQGNVEFFYQDSRGFLWMSSISGLNRYDGQHIRSYQPNPKDPGSIRGNNIQSSFFEDPDGNVWFSTYEAVNCYVRRQDAFRHFTMKDENGKEMPGYFLAGIDKKGLLWLVVQPNQLYTLDPKTGVFNFQGNTAPVTHAVSLYLNQAGYARYVISYAFDKPGVQINVLDGSSPSPVLHILDGNKGLACQKAVLEKDSLLWFATETPGLGCYHWKTGRTEFFSPKDKTMGPVKDIALSATSDMWISTQASGLWRFDRRSGQFTGNWRHNPGDSYTLGGKVLSRVYADRDGNVWIGVENTGVDIFTPEKVRFNVFYDKNNNASGLNHTIGALVETPDQKTWSCSDNEAVCVFDEEGNMKERLENKPGKKATLPEWPTRLIQDAKNRLWLLGWSELALWDAARHQFRSISKTGFISGCLLKNGTMLLSGLEGGLYALHEKPGGQFTLDLQPGIDPQTAFTSLHEDSQGRLWGCRNAANVSVYLPDGSGWKHFRDLDVKGDTKAYTEDPGRKAMWLATTEGLARVDLGDFRSSVLTEHDGLPNPTVYSVLPDANGCLWLGTNRGLSRFDPNTGKFQNFDRSDGLPGLEFNSFAFLQKKNGAFWFGTQGGGVAFNPENLHLLTTLARPTITNVLVNDQPDTSLYCMRTGAKNLSEIQVFEVDYQRNTLSFEFAALEFSATARNSFRYQMTGVDNAPVEAGTRGFARYADLSPGHYKMLIWASNSDGIWNPDPRVVEIVIKPPFWQTWWFITAMFVLLLALGFALYRYRISQLRREFQLRQIAQENELKATQNELKAKSSELKALRAQMSPHFMFNALNSINAAVLSGNASKASDQIGRFAQLMRSILQHSEQSVVALSDELKLLETYIQVEQQRFNPPFTCEIRVDPNISDPEDEPMPTMIIQPFVENAIWHGLQHLPAGSRQGHLLIAFEKQGELLHCIVEDNGVGRKRAEQLRSRPHTSYGMNIISERLRLLPGNNRFQVQDLHDGYGEAAGTRVDIWLEA